MSPRKVIWDRRTLHAQVDGTAYEDDTAAEEKVVEMRSTARRTDLKEGRKSKVNLGVLRLSTNATEIQFRAAQEMPEKQEHEMT